MLLGSSMQLHVADDSTSIGLPEVSKHPVLAMLAYSLTTRTVN
jgi:hypothetical protein